MNMDVLTSRQMEKEEKPEETDVRILQHIQRT
jgi:hypothetical protein